MSRAGIGYGVLRDMEALRPVRLTKRGDALLAWAFSFGASAAFFAGVFLPFYCIRR